jgi:hypothetical protein
MVPVSQQSFPSAPKGLIDGHGISVFKLPAFLLRILAEDTFNFDPIISRSLGRLVEPPEVPPTVGTVGPPAGGAV